MTVSQNKKTPFKNALQFLRCNAERIINLNGEMKLIAASVIVCTIIMSVFSILRMASLHSNAWDLGIYNQAMYTFVNDHKLFYLTPELLNNPGGSLFGIHFSPIFFIQTPIYLLYQQPETLLVLQSFALALGAVPTYLISKEYFKNGKWPLLLSFAYLLNPAVLGINVFDYHPEAFIPAFFLFTLLFYIKGNWKGMWFFSILLMMTIEFAPILLIVFSLFFIAKESVIPYIRHQFNQNNSRLRFFNLLALCIASIIWLIVAFKIINVFNPFVPLTQGLTENWSTLGASNILQVPFKALTNPANAINALTENGIEKITFLAVCSIPMLILPLFSIEFWLLGSPMLILALLSSSVNYYSIGGQYVSFLIGPLTFGGIMVVWRLTKIKRVQDLTRRIHFRGKPLVFGAVLFGLVLSNPFISLSVANNPLLGFGTPTMSDKALAVKDIQPLIPSNASVLTDSNIFPLFSSNINAYTLPFQIDYNNLSFLNYVDNQIKKVDYIVIDPDFWQPWPAITAVILSRTQEFGVIAYQDGVLALKRNYNGEPMVFKPPLWSFNCLNLYLMGGTIVQDDSSQSSQVIKSSPNASGTDFWWGPYIYLSNPGEYAVTFWLKTNDTQPNRIMDLNCALFPIVVSARTRTDNLTGSYQTLDLTTDSNLPQKLLSSTPLNGSDLKSNVYTPITMKFNASISGFYEFDGRNLESFEPIYLDRIDLTMLKPYAFTDPVYIQFNDFNTINYEQNHAQAINEVSAFIEPNSRLLLQEELYPLVAHYNSTIPLIFNGTDIQQYRTQLNALLKQSDFAMIDWKTNITMASFVLSRASELKNFGIYAFSDGVALLKRNYASTPVFINQTSTSYAYKDVIPQKGAFIVADNTSRNNYVVLHNSSDPEFWWGPYLYLFPGEYKVTYTIKVLDSNQPQSLTLVFDHFTANYEETEMNSHLTINFEGNKSEIYYKTLTKNDFPASNIFYNFTLNLIVDKFGSYEFPGRAIQTNSIIILDQITLDLTKPYSQFGGESFG